MPERHRILIVDDNAADRQAVSQALRRETAEIDGVEAEVLELGTIAAAREAISHEEFSCVFLAHDLPDGTSLDLLTELRAQDLITPVIVLTGQRHVQTIVEVMQAGAVDYLPKERLHPDLVARSLRAALLFRQAQREKQKVLDELRARDRAIAAAPNGIVITDPCQPDCPLVYVNEAFLRMTSYTEEEVLGRNCRFLQGPDTDTAAVRELREAVRHESPCHITLLNYRRDGTTFFNEVTISPVRDARGTLTHFVGIQSDITARHEADSERKRTEEERERLLAGQRSRAERETLLNQVGQALLDTTDPAAIQGRAATLLGEALGADRCYLSSWDAAGDHILVPQDHHRADLPSVAGEYSAPQYAPVMDALFARGTAVVPDVRSSGLPDNVVAMMTGYALNSVLAVPFFERGGRIAAALMVAMADAPRHWTPEEVSLTETVAALTRTAVESARVTQREHRIAEQLQAALQPDLPGEVPGLKVTRWYEPALTEEAGVGGDFYDVFAVEKACTALVVGDLSGKGLVAAANVSVVRNMLRAFLYSQPTLAEAVTALNRVLAENNLLTGFATLFVGAFDGGTRVLKYINCGQEPALVRRADSGEVEELAATGPILGSFQGPTFEERAVVLARGDALAIFSDGLTECGPNRLSMLGVEGVAALFGQPVPDAEALDASEVAERLALGLISGVDQAAAGGVMRDDVCLLVAVVE